MAVPKHMLVVAALLAACSAERRPDGPEPPRSPPNGPNDPRGTAFEANKYQLSQGGRYFAWFGCGSCHGQSAPGRLDLADGRWHAGGAFDQVYRSIAAGHAGQTPGYGETIPVEQLWQITAYVRSLRDLPPPKRRRGDFDQAGEPQASSWRGPVQ